MKVFSLAIEKYGLAAQSISKGAEEFHAKNIPISI